MTAIAPEPRPVRLTVDGIEHYGEWLNEARADAPVFVMLHDGLGCVANWRRFPGALAAATAWPVFAFDRWGYGRSAERAAFAESFMADEAGRLGAVLDAAGVEDCVLVGHSDGGTIALLHAAENHRRIRGLITMAAHVIVDPTAAVYLGELAADLQAGTTPAWLQRFHGDRGDHLLGCWVATWTTAFAAGWDITDRISAIEAPVLALQGALDPHKVPAQLARIAAAVPGAETVALDELGHFPHLERPDAVIGEIVRFVTKNGLGPPIDNGRI